MFQLSNMFRSLWPDRSGPVAGSGANERMDLHSGSPLWALRDGAGPEHAPLAEDLRTEVVIVGGGITGALCAYTFCQAGLDVAVVDARAFGAGSTCASTALLQYEIDTPLHELVDLVGEDHAVRSYLLSARAVERLGEIAREIGVEEFSQRPSVQYASRRSHVAGLIKEYAMRKANGLPVELLQEADEVRSVLPFDAPAALRTSLAAEMDALAFTRVLHAKSSAAGARIFEHSEVVDFRDTAGGIELRTASGHAIHARHLVYATGYETRDLLPNGIIRLHSTYALASGPGPSPRWPDSALIWETAKPYRYMRTTTDGRILLGGRDENFRSPALRDALLENKTKALAQDFRDLMPHVAFEPELSWCGTFGATKDGLPYIDRGPRDRNSYYALGMGGNGITFSLVAAEIIRDRILGRACPDAELFRFDR